MLLFLGNNGIGDHSSNAINFLPSLSTNICARTFASVTLSTCAPNIQCNGIHYIHWFHSVMWQRIVHTGQFNLYPHSGMRNCSHSIETRFIHAYHTRIHSYIKFREKRCAKTRTWRAMPNIYITYWFLFLHGTRSCETHTETPTPNSECETMVTSVLKSILHFPISD